MPGLKRGVAAGTEIDASTATFEQYVTSHWIELLRFARAVTTDREEVADAIQDALTNVFPRWSRVCRMDDPGAYLRRSIINAHVSSRRRGHRTTVVAELDSLASAMPDPAETVTDADEAMRLCRRLPARQRAAVVLRYLEDRSYGDIAHILKVSEATARSLVRHALTALRDQLALRR